MPRRSHQNGGEQRERENSGSLQEGEDRRNGRKARNWCFTVNNPAEPEATSEQLQALGESINEHLRSRDNIKRYCFQFEAGTRGTCHIQGYIGFTNMYRFSQVKATHPVFERAHCEAARGSVQANLE